MRKKTHAPHVPGQGKERRVKSWAPRCPGCNTPMLVVAQHPNPLAVWECVFCNRFFTDEIRTRSEVRS